MDIQLLKKLYESNSGDVIIITKDKAIRVSSNIIETVSPTINRMLNNETEGEEVGKVDMSHYHTGNVDKVFRYIYYKEIKFNKVPKLNWELFLMVERYELEEFKNELIGNISSIVELKADEDERANLMREYLHCSGGNHSITSGFIKYISKRIVENITCRSVCHDTLNYSKYRWCCKHNHGRGVSNNYLDYSINGRKGCICLNLLRLGAEKNPILSYHLEGQKDIVDLHTEFCCLHRSGNTYNFEYLKSLPEKATDKILQNLL
jgi:hypothetical protein